MGGDLNTKLVNKYLNKEVRSFTEHDNADNSGLNLGDIEFSKCNYDVLLKVFTDNKNTIKNIVEIGVARLSSKTYDETSTSIFINNKNVDCKYLGIDIDDKSFLDNIDSNVFTIKEYSQNYDKIIEKMKEVGMDKIDFLFIDGWHSINQVVSELYYFDFLSDNAIIGFHDTNFHPGPKEIIENINDDFIKSKHCVFNDDWGISFLYKNNKK